VQEQNKKIDTIDNMAKTIQLFEAEYAMIWDDLCTFPEFREFKMNVRAGMRGADVARNALNSYVNAVILKDSQKKKDFNLVTEEKVYVENFIDDRLYFPDVFPRAQTVNIPCSLIQIAILSAQQLTPDERTRLKESNQYLQRYDPAQQIRDIIDKMNRESGTTLQPMIFEMGR
jgi:hypothetical protein